MGFRNYLASKYKFTSFLIPANIWQYSFYAAYTLHHFFNYRDWGLKSDYLIPSYSDEPWDYHFLNEFLLNTISSEIPFVYISGRRVKVLTIPNFDFWMDFRTCLQGTGDWYCLQSRSDDNLTARSVIKHGAMSAFECMLERLEISHPKDGFKILFKYIDTSTLLSIFFPALGEFDDGGYLLHSVDMDGDCEWEDLLATLGEYASPRRVNLHSENQVDEFMGVYKDFHESFIGYVMDQHGILRFREFEGWSQYVHFRDQFFDSVKAENHSFH